MGSTQFITIWKPFQQPNCVTGIEGLGKVERETKSGEGGIATRTNVAV